jgi:hypothetical protein
MQPLVFQPELEMPPKTVRRLVLGGPSEQGTAIHHLALAHGPQAAADEQRLHQANAVELCQALKTHKGIGHRVFWVEGALF